MINRNGETTQNLLSNQGSHDQQHRGLVRQKSADSRIEDGWDDTVEYR